MSPSAAANQDLNSSSPLATTTSSPAEASTHFVNSYMASFSEMQIKEWDARSDVLLHFHAYRHFANKLYAETAIDLLNLDDADVQFYNRTSMMTRGLSISHQAAAYLLDITLKNQIAGADTHRKRFMVHVRAYNMGCNTRRRLYMMGFSADELNLMAYLSEIEPPTGDDGEEGAGWATDGLAPIPVSNHDQKIKQEEGAVEEAIRRCLEGHKKEIATKDEWEVAELFGGS